MKPIKDTEKYIALVNKIAQKILYELEVITQEAHRDYPESKADYSAFDDEDLVYEMFFGVAHEIIGTVVLDNSKKTPYKDDAFWQSIIGNCFKPRLNFNGRYRKEKFEDFAEACLLTDVHSIYNTMAPIPFDYEFHDRAG